MIRCVISQRHRRSEQVSRSAYACGGSAARASRTGIGAGIACRSDGRHSLIDLLVQEVVSARMHGCRAGRGRPVVGSFRNLLGIVRVNRVIVDVRLAWMVDRLDEAWAA